MPPAKQREYRALVNLSIGRVERTPNGREERAERVERGEKVWLTDADAENLGRYVRLVEDEETDEVPTHVSPKQILGIREVDKRGSVNVDGGALDVKDQTTVIQNGMTEAEADEEAQPTKNPSDPSYRGSRVRGSK